MMKSNLELVGECDRYDLRIRSLFFIYRGKAGGGGGKMWKLSHIYTMGGG